MHNTYIKHGKNVFNKIKFGKKNFKTEILEESVLRVSMKQH